MRVMSGTLKALRWRWIICLIVLLSAQWGQAEMQPPPPFVIELPPDLDALPKVPQERLPDEVLMEVLNRYLGKWDGTYEFSALQGGMGVQALIAQQHYWWDTSEDRPLLRGRGIFANESRISHSEMLSFVHEGFIYGMVAQNNKVRLFRGRVLEDKSGIVWMPIEEERFLAGQSTERFTTEDGVPVLEIDGFEPYVAGETETILILRGRLLRTGDE